VPPRVRPELLVLWDVDHTLIENGGVSKDTLLLAYELLTVNAPRCHPRRTAAPTSPSWRACCRTTAPIRRTSPPSVAGTLSTAGERNRSELAHRGHVLPGADQALKRVADDPRIVQSALTGNIEPNARLKLGTFGLDILLDFEVGAFARRAQHALTWWP
jgi:phosphoglycolate phosphatase